jgi:Glycosyl hydrolases family 2, TIM barrel domain/Glycosyl hydrolases family 2, sugar binding domain/Glycoside hydrolase family 2 C-terminal domain 5/Glycosyl hydrolases family 2
MAALALVGLFLIAKADFYPNRIYKIRQKTSLNQGWKFFLNNPTGDASSQNYTDASWATVNIPHSAMYVPPTIAGEATTLPNGSWTGICWYRKSFTVPSGAHTQKVYLEFEGAMQSSQIWVDGQAVGTHDACGYTGFWFDITNLVSSRTATHVVAIKLDCNYSNAIPPGNFGTYGNSNSYPDYYLQSGLYRDVWLVCSDNIAIPINGQKISTPSVVTGSSPTATVRVRTTVRNFSGTAAQCKVEFVIADSSNSIIADTSLTANIDTMKVFDVTSKTLGGVTLWSPETPYLYRVFTKVTVGAAVVDDYVDRFGIRKLDWTAANGFSLNGSKYELRGVCLHQNFSWVGNAVPHSRFFEEVKLIKNMGGNAIRCSHFPRDPSFYNACDELGMICEPELPTWGNFTNDYPTTFWDRMNVAAKEMIEVGYNHPSIILWGMFNEAMVDNFVAQLSRLNATIKSLDSTRYTSIIDNHAYTQDTVPDVYGLNYRLTPDVAGVSKSFNTYNSEYCPGWLFWCFRGDTVTTNNGTNLSEDEWNNRRLNGYNGSPGWTQIAGSTALAGGHIWCFIDYWSPFMNYPMGSLDHYRIPKKTYYEFRKLWTGNDYAGEYPTAGLTATKIQLNADVNTLIADSTDLSLIIASVRDASGKCVYSSVPVTFAVTGPCTVFDTLTRPAIAGKTALIIKSTNSTGTITVTASAAGLTPATVTLQGVAPDNSALPFIWPAVNTVFREQVAALAHEIRVVQTARAIQVSFASPGVESRTISFVNIRGERIGCRTAFKGLSVSIDLTDIVPGIYFVRASNGGQEVSKQIVVTKR